MDAKKMIRELVAEFEAHPLDKQLRLHLRNAVVSLQHADKIMTKSLANRKRAAEEVQRQKREAAAIKREEEEKKREDAKAARTARKLR